jgi:hypothetical protein
MPPMNQPDASHRLNVNGHIGLWAPTDWTDDYRSIYGNSTNGKIGLFVSTGPGNGSFMAISGKDATDHGKFLFAGLTEPSSDMTETMFDFARHHCINSSTPGAWSSLMTIKKDGRVVIGENIQYLNNNVNNYKLFVETGILTEKIKVALSNDPLNWSDFVFADDYQLRTLDEVEEYIRENKHLPEIPSTEEVHREGLDLAQMDARLLQKIEELTLYVIEQNKRIDRQQKEIDSLRNSHH